MILRDAQNKIKEMSEKFWVIALLGPRQSGKTTLARYTFPEHVYVSLENLETRSLAASDPKSFLAQFDGAKGVILDEIQHVPDLLSYMQTKVDLEKKPGFFVITGSQNLLLNQSITQTLAGRIFILRLLPLALDELKKANLLPATIETLLFQGCYPSIYAYDISPQDWYANYIQTYVERDVRQLKNIGDLSLFQLFVKLCAGRIGQLLNLTSLANDCGISVNTARSWISILEASYIVFLLQPHYKNFSKRLIKSPKLYFYDTGLASHLLGIESAQDLVTHYLRGGLFESLIISSLMKSSYNQGKNAHLYFWRDKSGNEIDCIIERGELLIPVEMKSGKTYSQSFFSSIEYFNEISQQPKHPSFVVYAGDELISLKAGELVGWRSLDRVVQD